MKYVWQRKTWPHFTWQMEPLAELLGQARLAQGKLISHIESLGFDLGQEAQANLITEETLTTSAIEGENLNPASVRSSVARHLGLPTVGLPPAERHIDGLVEVLLDATSKYAQPLTLPRIKGWHAALFPTGYSGIHQIQTGRWRDSDPMQIVSGPIGREKVHFEAPPSKYMEKEMGAFLSWWKKSLKDEKVEGILRAGIAHFHFVSIHPFEDGNGRLARALTDMALAQDEKMAIRFYSLSSQIMAERNAYYKTLERSQKGDGDLTEWLLWFVSCLERSIHRSRKIMEDTLQKAYFWRQHGQTSLNERQRKVINRLLDAGKEGFEGGLTTRKYVSLTQVSRATAFREIDDLVTKKILIANNSGGRSASYRLFDSGGVESD